MKLETLHKLTDKKSLQSYGKYLIVTEKHLAVTNGYAMIFTTNDSGIDSGGYNQFMEKKLDSKDTPKIDHLTLLSSKVEVLCEETCIAIWRLCYKIPAHYHKDNKLRLNKYAMGVSLVSSPVITISDSHLDFNPVLISQYIGKLNRNDSFVTGLLDDGKLFLTTASGFTIIVLGITR